MAIIIYTYSNPYKINKEPYWAMIKNSFQLCVSQTLVNGLCDQYSEFYKGKLTTISRFINNLYNDWESDAMENCFMDHIRKKFAKLGLRNFWKFNRISILMVRKNLTL